MNRLVGDGNPICAQRTGYCLTAWVVFTLQHASAMLEVSQQFTAYTSQLGMPCASSFQAQQVFAQTASTCAESC
jgi:hypothetical protein